MTTKKDLEEFIEQATEENLQVNIIKNKQKIKPNQSFSMVFNSNFSSVLKEYRLNHNDILILFTIIEYVNFGNLISLTQQTIANDLNTSQQNISKSWSKLMKAKILFKHNGSLFLNPKYIVKGNLKNSKESNAYKHIRNEIYDNLKDKIKNDEDLQKAVYKELPF